MFAGSFFTEFVYVHSNIRFQLYLISLNVLALFVHIVSNALHFTAQWSNVESYQMYTSKLIDHCEFSIFKKQPHTYPVVAQYPLLLLPKKGLLKFSVVKTCRMPNAPLAIKQSRANTKANYQAHGALINIFHYPIDKILEGRHYTPIAAIKRVLYIMYTVK